MFHGSFAVPGRLVGILGPVIQIFRFPVLDRAQYPASSCAVAGELVGDQHPGHVFQILEEFAGEPGRGRGIAPGGDQNVGHSAVLVHRPPQIVGLARDVDEHLVKVPRVPGGARRRRKPLA